MEFIISEMQPYDRNFRKTCKYLEKVIVKENLSTNGGTLNYSNLTYQSDLLLLASIDNKVIGFVSLIDDEDAYYVYQIAIKKEYQQKGIGSELIKKTLEIAKDNSKDVTANVMDYNTKSKKMFDKLGFVMLGYSSVGNGFYRYYQQNKEDKIEYHM